MIAITLRRFRLFSCRNEFGDEPHLILQQAQHAGANSHWARRRSIALAELVDEPWILPPRGTWYHDFVTGAFQTCGLRVPEATLVTHSIALRARALTEQPYLATLARSVVRMNTNRYALTILPVEFPAPSLAAGVLTLKNRTLSPIVERFIACAREVAKSLAGKPRSGKYPSAPRTHRATPR